MIEKENIIGHLRGRGEKSVFQWLRDGVRADAIDTGFEEEGAVGEQIDRVLCRVNHTLVGLSQEQFNEAIELGRKLRNEENSTTSDVAEIKEKF